MATTDEAIMGVIRAHRPSFRNNPHDKVAFVVHSLFLSSGYSLTATGTPAFSDTVLSSPPSDEVGIDGWNELEDRYGFVYSKTDKEGSKYAVLVKCLVMGDNLVIEAQRSSSSSGAHENEPASVVLNVNDYQGDDGGRNYADKYKNFTKLVEELKSGILSAVDGSSTAGSSSTAAGREATAPSKSERMEQPDHRAVDPQDFDPYHPGLVVPPVRPSGYDDVNPGPGAGMYPRVGPNFGGSMFIGPNDPRWFRPEQPGFALPPGVPPGARFDPYGPPGVPGFEPNRFGRGPRRPGNPDIQPFGDPDFI